MLFQWKKFHDKENKGGVVRNYGTQLPSECSLEEQDIDLLLDGPNSIVKKELEVENSSHLIVRTTVMTFFMYKRASA